MGVLVQFLCIVVLSLALRYCDVITLVCATSLEILCEHGMV